MSGRVPPSSRAGKPARRISGASRSVQRAADLFERFTGHDVSRGEVVDVPPLPDVVAIIGPVDFIGYTTVRDGRREKYIHHFAAKDRPKLAVTPDGSQILLIGGDYDFTERGIVDGSDLKTRREMSRD
jgi:hypothetical protein